MHDNRFLAYLAHLQDALGSEFEVCRPSLKDLTLTVKGSGDDLYLDSIQVRLKKNDPAGQARLDAFHFISQREKGWRLESDQRHPYGGVTEAVYQSVHTSYVAMTWALDALDSLKDTLSVYLEEPLSSFRFTSTAVYPTLVLEFGDLSAHVCIQPDEEGGSFTLSLKLLDESRVRETRIEGSPLSRDAVIGSLNYLCLQLFTLPAFK